MKRSLSAMPAWVSFHESHARENSACHFNSGRGSWSRNYEIVRGLATDSRFETKLCVLGNPDPTLDTTSIPGCEFLLTPVHVRTQLVRRLYLLRKLIRQWKPSIVHSHLWPSVLTVGCVLSRDVPHLIHVRDTPPSLNGTRWPDSIRRLLLQRIVNRPLTRLVAVSDSAADYTAKILGLDRSRIRTIVNGLSLIDFLRSHL